MSDIQINLICWTDVLCHLAADKTITQKDISVSYAMAKPSNLRKFLESVAECVHMGTLEVWRGLVDKQNDEAVKAEAGR